MNGKRWLTVLFSILIIFTLGCGVFTRLFPGKNTFLSTEPPTLPVPPKPSLMTKGTPEEQAVYFTDLLASPETRLAGWLGLYDALGIPVIGQDGSSLGSTGDDPIGPRYWQIWVSSGMDRPGRGIPFTNVGPIIAAGVPGLDGSAFSLELFKDLKQASTSKDTQAQLFAFFIRERVRRGASHVDFLDPAVDPETVIIDLPSLQLISWIMIRGSLLGSVGADRGGLHKAQRRPSTSSLALLQQGPTKPSPQTPCSNKFGGDDRDRWIESIINKNQSEIKLPWAVREIPAAIMILQRALGMDTKNIEQTAEILKSLNMIATLINLAQLINGLDVTAIQEPDPLERTKGTFPGKPGKITWAITSDPSKLPVDNPEQPLQACLLMYAASEGISFTFPPDGRVENVSLQFKGRTGFTDLVKFPGLGDPKILEFEYTNAGGEVTTNLIGAGQKRTLQESSKPVDKEFSILVTVKPQLIGGSSGSSGINAGGIVFTGKGGTLQYSSELLSNIRFELGEYVFRLTDWQSRAYRATGRNGDIVFSGLICSLDKPFIVNASWLTPIEKKFDPATGTWAFSTTYSVVAYSGNGTFTIEGADTDHPRILVNGTEVLKHPYGGITRSGTDGTIDLVPLETDECK